MQLLQQLKQINVFKQGQFTLKSGEVVSLYVDLRPVISYPKLLRAIAERMWGKLHETPDLICGVPYTALPIVCCLSTLHEQPMILCRKQAKDYGTKRQVEGVFYSGQSCVLFEDVITSAESVFQIAHYLEEVGLTIVQIIVFVDRQQGGKERLERHGYQVSSVLTLEEIDTFMRAQS